MGIGDFLIIIGFVITLIGIYKLACALQDQDIK